MKKLNFIVIFALIFSLKNVFLISEELLFSNFDIYKKSSFSNFKWDFQVQTAYKNIEKSEYEKAIENFEKAITKGCKSSLIFFDGLNCLFKLKKTENFGIWIDHNSVYFDKDVIKEALIKVGDFYFEDKKFDDAFIYYEKTKDANLIKNAYLNAGDYFLQLDKIKIFSGHSDIVKSIAFSPDGKYIISASWDKTLKLWDVSTGKELRTFQGHYNKVTAVAFSPDGKYVISASWDKTLRLWDLSTGKELKKYSGHYDSVKSITFSPDGKYIIISPAYLELLDLSTGKELKTFSIISYATAVAFSPDGKYVISDFKNTLILWISNQNILAFNIYNKILNEKDAYLRIADKNFENKKYASALYYYKKIGINEKDIFIKIANKYLDSMDYENTIFYFEKAGEKDKAKKYYNNVADEYLKLKDYDKAIDYYEKAHNKTALIKIVNNYISLNYNYTENINVILFDAIDKGDFVGVKSALIKGANINIRWKHEEREETLNSNYWGISYISETPLFRASIKIYYYDIIEYLILKGADINSSYYKKITWPWGDIEEQYYSSVLDYAIKTNFIDLIYLLKK
ncbi:MAG: PD40 domain-containing protein [Spirochaetes bacterium]|nr:PD40 domain-containing protein [Spirochaetota bacterium]